MNAGTGASNDKGTRTRTDRCNDGVPGREDVAQEHSELQLGTAAEKGRGQRGVTYAYCYEIFLISPGPVETGNWSVNSAAGEDFRGREPEDTREPKE